jgi:hypothetical protein
MQLKTESGRPTDVTNLEQVRDALSKLNENEDGFVILEDGERLIQTAFDDSGLVVEKSESSEAPLSEKFALADAETIFQAWYQHSPMPSGLQWSIEEESGTPRPFHWLLWALPLAGGAFVIYQLAR